MTRYFADQALLPDGWATDVQIEVAPSGDITSVTPHSERGTGELLHGPVLPGMPNLHSHAFQRALAGRAEWFGGGSAAKRDDFWTWREAMYRFLDRLDPDDVEAVAAHVYLEMVRNGYTAVGEFHYLHNTPSGRCYENPAELSLRILAAARRVGLGITHLPVLYVTGGFGGLPPTGGQRRFLTDVDQLHRILETLRQDAENDPQVRIGVAPHSLRAVTPGLLTELLERTWEVDSAAPVHIHVAEQKAEVQACLSWSGARPVAWLLDHAPVDERWCLIHATHMDREESAGVAGSGAVVGLCPTTEANLGDGLFGLREYLENGGRWGIGSDSQVSVSPVEELRWLEYGQRLVEQTRLVAPVAGHSSTGRALYQASIEGGAQALGRPIGRIAPGSRADLVVVDRDHPGMIGRQGDLILDGMIFVGDGNPVRDVMIGGQWQIRDGHHADEAEISSRYRAILAKLLL